MNKSQYCTFYIVRHGETEWNLKQLLQGQEDSPLTQKGIQQAEELRKELSSINFDYVFSSDLLRAKRTAQIITLEKKLAIKTSQLLRERSFGKYEGKAWGSYKTELGNLFNDYNKLSDKEKMNFKNPEIENDNQLISRFVTFLREIALSYPNKTILVVSHGGMMRALLIHLGFATYSNLPPGAIENCSYIKLDSDGTDFFIKETKNIVQRIR